MYPYLIAAASFKADDIQTLLISINQSDTICWCDKKYRGLADNLGDRSCGVLLREVPADIRCIDLLTYSRY